MRRAAPALLWLATSAACGGGQARPDYGVPDGENDPAAERLLAGEERAATRTGTDAPATEAPGTLTRKALDETLAAGPGAFLGKVRVRAVAEKSVFRGWVIVALWPGADVELAPGDVVKRLNGRTLERPDDVSALWDTLRQAREIVVEYERGGEPRVLRVPVVE